jgi:hypothetical protein
MYHHCVRSTTLSERFLEEEVARVQNSIDNDLENAEYLTLSMIFKYCIFNLHIV